MNEILHHQFQFELPTDRFQPGTDPAPDIIRCDLRVPVGAAAPLPTVIVCHGFKGFKNWGFHPYIGETLARNGFASLHFNFSLNGVGEDLLTFTELERFRSNTLSREAAELRFILDQVSGQATTELAAVDPKRIGLIGHSRGAFSVFSVGGDSRVGAIVTLAGVSKFTVPREREELWRRDGVHYVENTRTKERLPMGLDLLEDLKKHSRTIENSVKNLHKPLLIIHGEADDAVPISAAEDLASWAENGRLLKIPAADHVFGARHPFVGPTPELSVVLGETIQFLRQSI